MIKKTKSQTYFWLGKNRNGERIKGEQEAQHIVLLKSELRRRGIIAIKIRKKSVGLFSARKPNKEDIRIFSRQLATMSHAGIPFIQALDMIEKSQDKISMKALVAQLKTAVESGTAVAEALKNHANYFNALYCNLVAVGERSGTLDLMFERIATYQEKIHSLKSKIKKALFYPTAVIMVAVVVTIGLLIFVVPQFEALFNGFGAQLPYPTQIIINVSRFLQNYGGIIFILFAASIGGLISTQKRSVKFAERIDNYLLRLPIIGVAIRKAVIARFARTLATTFAAGLPLIDALQAVSGATGNRIYTHATLNIKDHVTAGQTLNFSIRQTNLFPNMVVQMIAMGEASGTLEIMLNKIASIFEEEVDHVVDNLTDLLEPLIMIVLGVLIGGLVIAMYLPIFRLGSVV